MRRFPTERATPKWRTLSIRVATPLAVAAFFVACKDASSPTVFVPTPPVSPSVATAVVSLPIQSGSSVLAGSSSIDVAIAPVDLSRSFLIFGASLAGNTPRCTNISGQITNPSTLTFARGDSCSGSNVFIEWYVAEFTNGVLVQRGSENVGALSNTIPISPVDPSKSFVIMTERALSGSSMDGDDFHKAKLLDGSTLEVSGKKSTSGGRIAEWQVIEYADATVQTGNMSFGASESSKTVTITGVNTAKAWLLFTYASSTGSWSNIGQKMVRGRITDPTTLVFDRDNVGQGLELTWYLVEFTDNTTVQHGNASLGAGATQTDVALSSVDMGRSIAVGGGYDYRGGKTPYSEDDDPGVGSVTLDLTSATNLRLTRATTGSSTADIGWFVVEFDLGGPPPPPEPDLIVQNESLSPALPPEGEAVTFTADVVNNGSATGGASSTTRLLIDGTPVVPDQTTADLAPAAWETESWSWTAVKGDHTYQVCADEDGAGGVIAESNEANNCSPVVPFTVSGPPPLPVINVTPNSLAFGATLGGPNPAAKTLEIANGGGLTLDWSIVSDQGWVTPTPASGTAATEIDEVTVLVDLAGLAQGTYSATLTVTAPEATNSPQSVEVTLVVSEPPNVDIVWPTNGWAQATPAEMGMDEAKLADARDYAINTNGGGGSGVITRHGRVVMSWGDQHHRYDIKSSTKSIGSTMLGLAIGDGLMSLSDLAQQHHPSIGTPPQSNEATGWLDDISILHLATQTAGFMKPGGYAEINWAPGTMWHYSDGGPNWLAEAITLEFGVDLLSVLSSRIMAPLGVPTQDYDWRQNAYRDAEINGITNREFGSGIRVSVDAAARIGYLYLRDGEWDGTQILPDSYVASARSPIPGIEDLPSSDAYKFANAPRHYGLLWWNNADGVMPNLPTDAFFSWGLYESFIIVVPSLDIVIARAGSAWRADGGDPFYPVLQGFLTPIVESVMVP